MNLIKDRWISVRRSSGEIEKIAPRGLTDEIDADPIIRLATPRADFDAAIAQLLIGLLQASFGVKNPREWRQRFDSPPPPEDLAAAFDQLGQAFELLGEGRPRCFQDFDLTEEASSRQSIGRILIEYPGASTVKRGADFFVKRGSVDGLCECCAAAGLLALQTNAPSGGQGHRVSLRGGGPLTSLIVTERSLWHTLWLNVLPGMDLENLGNSELSKDGATFPWLSPTRTSEPTTGVKTTPMDTHPLQMYFGMPRRIVLDEPSQSGDCDLCGDKARPLIRSFIARKHGTDYSGPWKHALTPYREDDGQPISLKGRTTPFGYKDWLGLLQIDESRNRVTPALVVQVLFRERDRYTRAGLRLWVSGFATDNMKALAWADGVMPVITTEEEVRPEFQRDVERLVLAARLVEGFLGKSLARLPSADAAPVKEAFWRETEPAFLERASELVLLHEASKPTTQLREEWHLGTLVRTANRLFEMHTATDFRVQEPRAIASAWKALQRGLWGKALRTALGI